MIVFVFIYPDNSKIVIQCIVCGDSREVVVKQSKVITAFSVGKIMYRNKTVLT